MSLAPCSSVSIVNFEHVIADWEQVKAIFFARKLINVAHHPKSTSGVILSLDLKHTI